MSDLDPIRAQAEIDISSMQTGFAQLAQAVQEAVGKIKDSLTDASSHTRQKTHEIEEETNGLGDAFKKLGTNVYENIHTPFGEIHERFTGFIEELSGTTLAVGGAIAAIAVIGHELSEMSDEFAQTTRQLSTQAQMFSLSTETMQVFGEAAKQVGQSSQSIVFGLRSLERVFETNSSAAAEFGGSNQKASSILKEYGLTTGTTQEKLERFIQVLHETNDEGERHRLILELIGARGLLLLPVLEQLANKGYANIKDEMKELNVLLDENAIKTGDDAYAANLRLSESWEGVKNQISIAVTPIFIAINNALAEAIIKTREWTTELGGLAAAAETTFAKLKANFTALKEDLPLISTYFSTVYSWTGKAVDGLVNWNVGVDRFIYKYAGMKLMVDLWEKANQLASQYSVPLEPPPPSAPAAPPVSAVVQPQSDRAKMDALLETIKELEAEGIKHQKVLLDHAAALHQFAAEFGENAPTELKKFVNELNDLQTAIYEKGEKAVEKAYAEMLKSGKEFAKENQILHEKTNTDMNDDFKRTTEENKKELDERTKEVLKYVKMVHGLAMEDANQAEALGKIKIKADEENVTFQENTHKISAAKALQMRKDLAKEELKIESDKVEAEIKIEELSPDSEVKVKQLQDKLVQLQKNYNLQIENLDEKAIETRQKKFESFFKSMQAGMDTAINGWLQGTQTLSQTWVKTLDGMLIGLARMLENMLAKWLEHLILKDALSQSFSLKESLRAAYLAAKAAFKSAMDLPVPINFVMAPIMAAAAFAGTMEIGSAAQGMVVPYDNYPSILHAKEMVLPASISQGLQNMINSGRSGGGMVIHPGAININSSATNARDLVRDLIPELQRASRLGKF